MTVVQVGKDLFRIPDFIHDYGDEDNHTFKGSLKRHIAVEKAVYFLWSILNSVGDAFPLYNLFMAPIEVALGFNCNFPAKDVARYVVWSLRKGCFEWVGEAKNNELSTF